MNAGRGGQGVKRALDMLGAIALLAVFWPVMGLVAVWIKLDSPGPALYVQWRVGKCGKPFQMLKFRTMVVEGESHLEGHFETNPEARLTWDAFQKLIHDPRLTRPGRVLRQFSLDELPQLWNVLCGEMSLVGPRPCLPEQRSIYGEYFGEYAAMRPGMTGLWQVSGRNRLSFAERVMLDVQYVRGWSLRLDLKILMKTIKVVLYREGAF